MSNKLVEGLATFFYLGYAPVCPGSVAAIAGVILAVILAPYPVVYGLAVVLVAVVGFLVSGRMEKISVKKDPSCVVIDEVAGMLLALLWLPLSWPVVLSAYFLFRAFDMFKIYPADKLENIPGAAGIMLDDLAAGLYTNIVMHLALRLSGVNYNV